MRDSSAAPGGREARDVERRPHRPFCGVSSPFRLDALVMECECAGASGKAVRGGLLVEIFNYQFYNDPVLGKTMPGNIGVLSCTRIF